MIILIFLFILVILIITTVVVSQKENNNMNNKHNAKYVFYYLLSLVALIFMALASGMVIFGIINTLIPDTLNVYGGNQVDSQLKFAISALLIATPIFYYVSSLIHKGFRRGELEKNSAIRRWLTYFILLVTSLIILGVFISVINNFLAGELTGRFIFKALTMIFIAGLTFSFYFYDIKREDPERSDKVIKIFFVSTLLLVIIIFTAAWFFIESPSVTRARRLDQDLVQNMINIENSVNSYYNLNKKLPDSLESLQADRGVYLDKDSLSDPATKELINYQKEGERTFSLCATFRTDSLTENNKQLMRYEAGINNKKHSAGYQCLAGYLQVPVEVEMVK